MSTGQFELGLFDPLISKVDRVKQSALHVDITFTDKDHCIRAPKLEGSPFNHIATDLRQYIHIETHAGGGASVVHMYQNEIDTLSKPRMDELARLFFEEVFREDKRGNAHHVMGIVHSAAAYLPELVSYLGQTHPDLDVKVVCVYVCVAGTHTLTHC